MTDWFDVTCMGDRHEIQMSISGSYRHRKLAIVGFDNCAGAFKADYPWHSGKPTDCELCRLADQNFAT